MSRSEATEVRWYRRSSPRRRWRRRPTRRHARRPPAGVLTAVRNWLHEPPPPTAGPAPTANLHAELRAAAAHRQEPTGT